MILNHDGTVRIERGFIRTEDEKPEPQAEHSADEPSSANVDVEGVDGRVEYADGAAGEDAADEEDNDSPLSDILVRDLTAHRTLGLRLNLSEQPDLAVVAAPIRLPPKSSISGRKRTLSAFSRSRSTWRRMRTASRTPRLAARGRSVMPIGQGRCPATLPICGPLWLNWIMTA